MLGCGARVMSHAAGMHCQKRIIQISEIQLVLQSQQNVRNRSRDLARDECLPAPGRFVVEQNPVAGVHVVGLAVVHHRPDITYNKKMAKKLKIVQLIFSSNLRSEGK